MKGLVFRLSPHTSLTRNSKGYFIFSEAPIRVLKLNATLFSILNDLQGGAPYSDLFRGSALNEARLLRTLLGLVSRGYLKLECPPLLDKIPTVSVIVPVRDQARDLAECLTSLDRLDYPADKLDIIVVDDGSLEKISNTAGSHLARILRLENSRGPAAARNLGVENSQGDILAFMDADCIAGANWLSQIVPFFAIDNMGAVGGLVESFYTAKALDRYEEVSSSLNLGPRLLFDNERTSNFYVPTCNMLVRRTVFLETGGFKAEMRVGEDVDFCWRMRAQGSDLLYLPFGKVEHKHRNQLLKMLQRRHVYGTSEAVLCSGHSEKKKKISFPLTAGFSFLSMLIAILLLNPYPLAAILPLFLIAIIIKRATLARLDLGIPLRKIAVSTLRSFLSLAYFSSFHLLRYYLILLVALGILWHPLWIFCGAALLFTSLVDYALKKPRLLYPLYLFYYTLEHLAYQSGVFWGCLRRKSFRAYLPRFVGPILQ